jgi:hypothetical protein
MTKADFIALVRVGYMTLDHHVGTFFSYRNGQEDHEIIGPPEDYGIPACACAVGSAAFAAGIAGHEMCERLRVAGFDPQQMFDISDACTNKAQVLERLEAELR